MEIQMDRGWHIKKEFSIGDIVALVFAGAAVLMAYGKLDTRVTVIEEMRKSQMTRDETQDAAMAGMHADLGARLTRIEDKLDRLRESK